MSRPPLIDCRPFADYCSGHIAGATTLPAGELFLRMHELPLRHIPLTLCGDEHSLAMARHFLLEREFTITRDIVWSAELVRQLTREDTLETGPHSVRLWQPAPLLQEFVSDILPHHATTDRQGIDIACGSGRDSVFMALHGWHMLAIDNSADALQRAQSLAQHSGISIRTQQVELEKHADPFNGIDAMTLHSADLVMVFRYLHRPLLPLIRKLIRPQGFIIYQTFMHGCEKISSPRNPRFLLQPGELATAFAGFDILRDDIILLEDGRPVSAFVARNRC